MTRLCSSGRVASAPRSSRASSRRATSTSVRSAAANRSSMPSSLARRRSWTVERRRLSIARLWTMPRIHVRTDPRARSYRAPERHRLRNASCTTSSAALRLWVIRWASEKATVAWRSYTTANASASPRRTSCMRSSSARLVSAIPRRHYAAGTRSDQRRRMRRTSSSAALTMRWAKSTCLAACARWRPCCLRIRRTTSPVPAAAPTAAAATGRTQLRGSRMADSSQASSSSAASSVRLVSVVSRRWARSSGGSTGASARRSSPSKSGAVMSFMSARPCLARGHDLLELLDGAMEEHLRRAVRAIHRPRDLAVVHAQREAHDERLATVVGKLLDALQDARQLVAALDEVLRRVHRPQRAGVLDRRLRLARAVAVEVRSEVVRDADQPRPQRPPVRLAYRPLEVTVGLQERLLREVLGVVVVPHAVVGVGVHVPQVGAV